MKLSRPISEAEAAHAAPGQHRAGAAVRIVDPGHDAQSAVILAGRFDPANALFGAVLPI